MWCDMQRYTHSTDSCCMHVLQMCFLPFCRIMDHSPSSYNVRSMFVVDNGSLLNSYNVCSLYFNGCVVMAVNTASSTLYICIMFCSE